MTLKEQNQWNQDSDNHWDHPLVYKKSQWVAEDEKGELTAGQARETKTTQNISLMPRKLSI